MRKLRLETALIERGFAKNKKEAFVVVTEGRVFVNGQKAVSPSQLVGADDEIEVRSGREFVGRGAYKLEAAVGQFGIDVRGKICADVGAATGGFTEVLLKHGAKKVYAIDVGRGKLDLKLREDPRVVVIEDTNVLTMPPLPEPVDLVTIDVSFTSLRQVLPAIKPWLRLLYYSHDRENSTANWKRAPAGSVVALFKPQYELRDKAKLSHGVIRDERVRAEVLDEFRAWLKEKGWKEYGFMESPVRGSEGNVEYLFYLRSN